MLHQQWWRAGHIIHVQKKQVAGEVSMVLGSVSVGVARVYTRCGRYPVSIDLSAEEGKEEPTF